MKITLLFVGLCFSPYALVLFYNFISVKTQVQWNNQGLHSELLSKSITSQIHAQCALSSITTTVHTFMCTSKCPSTVNCKRTTQSIAGTEHSRIFDWMIYHMKSNEMEWNVFNREREILSIDNIIKI